MNANIPNRLTFLRFVLSPLFSVFVVYPIFGEKKAYISIIIGFVFFAAASFTDYLDGKLARKYKIVSKLGIFLDPLADKYLIFCALLSLSFSDIVIPDGTFCKNIFFWASCIIIFRELAVTTMRLVASSKVTIPANFAGKAKTVSQMICIMTAMAEAVVLPNLFGGMRIFTIVTTIVATVLTVWSGIIYLNAYKSFLGLGEQKEG